MKSENEHPSVSIVIPAYNAGTLLPTRVEKLRDVMSKMALGDYEIVIVDDGSNDNTSSVAESMGDPVHAIRHKQNRGKGAAVRTGMLF